MIGFVIITRYHVVENQLFEVLSREPRSFRVREINNENWLFIGRGPESMPFDRVPETFEKGWSANAGTAPVKVDANGFYGGRNYPKIVVPGYVMRQLYEGLRAMA